VGWDSPSKRCGSSSLLFSQETYTQCRYHRRRLEKTMAGRQFAYHHHHQVQSPSHRRSRHYRRHHCVPDRPIQFLSRLERVNEMVATTTGRCKNKARTAVSTSSTFCSISRRLRSGRSARPNSSSRSTRLAPYTPISPGNPPSDINRQPGNNN
jgi:hypothetical protein